MTNATVQLSDVSQIQAHSEPASMQAAPAAQGVLPHTPGGCAGACGSSPARDSKRVGPDTQGLRVPQQRYAQEQQLRVCTQHGQDEAGTALGNADACGEDNCSNSCGEDTSSNAEGVSGNQDVASNPTQSCRTTRQMYSGFELVSPPSSNQDLSSPTVITMHHQGHRYFSSSESCLESFGGNLTVCMSHERLALNSERYSLAKQKDCGEQDCVSTPSAACAKVTVEGSVWEEIDTARGGGGGGTERCTGHEASGGARRHIQFVAREGETPAGIIQQVCM
jgi:hypothetical protein